MPAQEIHNEWAKTLAEKLVASGDAPPVGLRDDERLALAWALKDLAFAAWSTEPAQVEEANCVLHALCQSAVVSYSASISEEIGALSAWVQGIAYITSGRMTDAISALDQAEVAFRELHQPLHAALTQPAKIVALSTSGRTTEAAQCGSLAQHELELLGDKLAASRVCLNIGYLFCASNDYLEARRHFKKAAMHFALVGDHEHAAMSSLGIGLTFDSTGEFDAALDIYDKLLVSTKEQGLPVLESYAQESIALVQLARGQFREALAGLESNRNRYVTLAMPQHSAAAEKRLADAYVQLHLLPEALALLDNALISFDKLEMPLEKAWALAQKGRALVLIGSPPDVVEAPLIEATEIFLAQRDRAGTATVLMTRADLALSLGDGASAAKHSAKASSIFASTEMVADQTLADATLAHARYLTNDLLEAKSLFLEVLSRAARLQLQSVQTNCLVGLGLVAVKRGDPTGAERLFANAIEMLEEQRRALPVDELRHSFLANNLRPYEEMLRLALRADVANPSVASAGSVLTRLESFRARAVNERLGAAPENDTDASVDSTAVQMRTQLNWLHIRSRHLLDQGESNISTANDARRVELDLLEHVRRHRLVGSTDATPSPNHKLDIHALRLALALGEAIVEYGVLDNELFTCVGTHNGIGLKRHLAKWSDVVEAAHAARFQIETLRNGTGELTRHLELLTRRSQIALRRLHDLIWAPLADLLMSCQRVLVVPHEQLGWVPFSALHDGEQYLSQRYEISVAPSARVALRGLGRHPLPPRRAVILGESSRLVHAAEEAQFVASLFEEATVLTGQDANGDALRAASVQADVLHLACHGQFRSDNPMFSALHLVDGPFTVQDAEALRLPQGVVVLSACESGVATASKGDEVIGLVRAFLIAGAARVVASLWPVDDKVTTEFMAAFYSSLRAGAAPAAALRSAQLEVMKTHPHPFHWAAFTVYGGW